MALTVDEILTAVNSANFTIEELTGALAGVKLQSRLSTVQSQIANLQKERSAYEVEYLQKLDDLQSEAAAIQAEIEALAPSS